MQFLPTGLVFVIAVAGAAPRSAPVQQLTVSVPAMPGASATITVYGANGEKFDSFCVSNAKITKAFKVPLSDDGSGASVEANIKKPGDTDCSGDDYTTTGKKTLDASAKTATLTATRTQSSSASNSATKGPAPTSDKAASADSASSEPDVTSYKYTW